MKLACKTWTDYPTGPTSATIYFHGFLGLCFNDKQCEVGINRNAPSHEMSLQLRVRGKPICEEITLDKLPTDFATGKYKLHFRVENPVQKGVFIFDPTPPDARISERYSYAHYGFDMEGPQMHNRPVKKLPDALWPRFTIDNGLFYTYLVSESLFTLMHGATTVWDRKQIGLVLAADIYLDTGGSIGIYLDDGTTTTLLLKLLQASGEKYEIAITNSCRTTPVPTGKTDFYMNYDAIDKTDVLPTDIFDLYLEDERGDRRPVVFGPCEMGDFVFSDPAPCLPVTFGQSVNLD